MRRSAAKVGATAADRGPPASRTAFAELRMVIPKVPEELTQRRRGTEETAQITQLVSLALCASAGGSFYGSLIASKVSLALRLCVRFLFVKSWLAKEGQRFYANGREDSPHHKQEFLMHAESIAVAGCPMQDSK